MNFILIERQAGARSEPMGLRLHISYWDGAYMQHRYRSYVNSANQSIQKLPRCVV
jgi:hypothetical protein